MLGRQGGQRIVAIQQAIIIRYGIVAIRMEPFLPTDTYRFLGVNIGQGFLFAPGLLPGEFAKRVAAQQDTA